MDLVRQRDALAAEACALYCQQGRPQAARELLQGRRWQPWEGGEGEALSQHVRCHLALVSRWCWLAQGSDQCLLGQGCGIPSSCVGL